MKISAAIITRNRAAQLNRCLISLTRQTVKPEQVLVIDNNSTDRTKDVVFSFNNRLPISYVFEERIGKFYARNRALKKAKYNIIAFIDDDCEAFPNWIEEILAAHKRHTRAIAIQGWSIHLPSHNFASILSQFNLENGFKSNIIIKYPNSLKHFLKIETPILILDTRNVSFKNNHIKKKGIQFNDVAWFEDLDFAKQLLSVKEEIQFCPRVKVYHWEKSNLGEFLSKRFLGGKSKAVSYIKWKKHFPKRSSFWWVKRFVDFILFSIKNHHLGKLIILIPLYLLENSVYMFGFLLGSKQK